MHAVGLSCEKYKYNVFLQENELTIMGIETISSLHEPETFYTKSIGIKLKVRSLTIHVEPSFPKF